MKTIITKCHCNLTMLSFDVLIPQCDSTSGSVMFKVCQVSSSAMCAFLVEWHTGDAIFEQVDCSLNDIIFILHIRSNQPFSINIGFSWSYNWQSKTMRGYRLQVSSTRWHQWSQIRCNLYFVNSHRIPNNSATTNARVQLHTSGILGILEKFSHVWLNLKTRILLYN